MVNREFGVMVLKFDLILIELCKKRARCWIERRSEYSFWKSVNIELSFAKLVKLVVDM